MKKILVLLLFVTITLFTAAQGTIQTTVDSVGLALQALISKPAGMNDLTARYLFLHSQETDCAYTDSSVVVNRFGLFPFTGEWSIKKKCDIYAYRNGWQKFSSVYHYFTGIAADLFSFMIIAVFIFVIGLLMSNAVITIARMRKRMRKGEVGNASAVYWKYVDKFDVSILIRNEFLIPTITFLVLIMGMIGQHYIFYSFLIYVNIAVWLLMVWIICLIIRILLRQWLRHVYVKTIIPSL